MKNIISLEHWNRLVNGGIPESELMNGGAKTVPIECPNEKCRAKLWDLPDKPGQEERDIVCMVCTFKGTRKKGK